MMQSLRRENKTIQENWKELGLFLKERRLSVGLSQGEVAKKLGYKTPQFISNIERGAASPPMNLLKELIHLYKISPRELTLLLTNQQRRYYQSEFS